MDKVCIENIKLENSNGKTIYVNVCDKKSKNVFIAVHGFDSSKSGSFVNLLMDSLDASVVSFDLPMHGESTEDLLLSNCILDLEIVDSYVRDRFSDCSISLIGSSFGCFVILNYLKKHSDLEYKNIFFKSAAIKMDKVFSEVLIEEDMDSFEKRGYSIKNRNKKMLIPYKFYEELVYNRINMSDFKDREFYLFHGVNDDTALYDDLGVSDLSNFHVVKYIDNHTFDNSNLLNVVKEIHKVLK